MIKPTKSSGNPAKPPTASTSAIPWPALSPPSHPLETTQLYPGLLAIDSFLSKRDLTTWISFLTSPSSPIVLQSSPPKKRGEAHRTNDRFGVQDPAFAEALWTRTGLRELCEGGRLESRTKGKEAVGLNPNIRLYRYDTGAFFGRTFLSPSPSRTSKLIISTRSALRRRLLRPSNKTSLGMDSSHLPHGRGGRRRRRRNGLLPRRTTGELARTDDELGRRATVAREGGPASAWSVLHVARGAAGRCWSQVGVEERCYVWLMGTLAKEHVLRGDAERREREPRTFAPLECGNNLSRASESQAEYSTSNDTDEAPIKVQTPTPHSSTIASAPSPASAAAFFLLSLSFFPTLLAPVFSSPASPSFFLPFTSLHLVFL